MDSSAILERVRSYWLPITLGVCGVVFLIYGAFSLTKPKENSEILFESGTQQTVHPSGGSQSLEAKKITVDIEGGVIKPGVYELPAESRIQDALVAAGGMSSAADRVVVSKSLNLAAKLTDGAKIYIPIAGEPLLASGSTGSSGQTVLGSEVININAASVKELDTLPGVGEVTTQKIISNRPYGSVDELLTKKIVGKKVFDEIKEKISVY